MGKKLTDAELKSYIGRKFGKLMVIEVGEYIGKPYKLHYFKCKCDCGNEISVRKNALDSGNTKSCGCYNPSNIKHNKSDTRIYKIYAGIKKRCFDKNCKSYSDYGARGITICQEWLNDFMSFYNWSIQNGYQDDLTIDRKDVNGNYEPNNCRWADRKTQNRNTRRNHLITINGITKTLVEWSEYSGIQTDLIRYRLNHGITGEDLFKPPRKEKRIIIKYNDKDYNPNSFCKEFNIPKTSFYREYFEYGKNIKEIIEKYNSIKRRDI